MRLPILIGLALFTSVCITCSKPRTIEETFSDVDSFVVAGKSEEALELLRDLEERHPSDTSTVIRCHSTMADVYGGQLHDTHKAVELLMAIVARYPDRPEASTSLFKIGFTYETVAHDMTKAREVYESFLKKYPDHELATSVRINLEHLGESEEEMLNRILEKNRQDSLSQVAGGTSSKRKK